MLDFIVHHGLGFASVWLLGKAIPSLTNFATTLAAIIVFLSVAKVAAYAYRILLPRRRVSTLNKAVFITGCDSGFGHLTAKKLDADGFKVFAGCLNPSGDGAAKLKATCSNRLRILSVDVTKDEDIRAAAKVITEELGAQELWGIVNNAGIAMAAELEWCNLDRIRQVFEVNTFGMVRVTQVFLPLLRRSRGRVVNVTSGTTRLTCPGFVPYCMSKWAALCFCEGLRVEVMKWGIKVCSIEPWLYRTTMTTKDYCFDSIQKLWDEAPSDAKETYGPKYLEAFKQSTLEFLNTGNPNVSDVVDSIFDAIVAKEPRIYYQPADLITKFLYHCLQTLPQSVIDFILAVHMPRTKPAILDTKKCK